MLLFRKLFIYLFIYYFIYLFKINDRRTREPPILSGVYEDTHRYTMESKESCLLLVKQGICLCVLNVYVACSMYRTCYMCQVPTVCQLLR